MKPATTEFLRQRFAEYYRKERIQAPPSIGEREFGFILFDPEVPEVRMRRFMGFGTPGELGEYIRSLVPAHAFYSSAYYTAPGAGTMPEKGWTGADLIFDLDADHLMRGPYRAMLDRVKLETGKLLAMLAKFALALAILGLFIYRTWP